MHYCNMLMLVVLCEGIIELTCMQKSDTISNIQSAILIPKKKKNKRRKGEEEEEEEEETSSPILYITTPDRPPLRLLLVI